MTEVRRIDGHMVEPAVLKPFAAAVDLLGSDRFYRTLSGSLGVLVDRFYLIDGSTRSEPLIMQTELDKPVVNGSTYVKLFLPNDPLQLAIDSVKDDDTILCLKVAPCDIVVPAYRSMLERASVVERVSFIRKLGRNGWRCMTVVRRKTSGRFTERELSLLGSAYRLLTPLVDRHRSLIGEVVENRADRIAELEERFGQRYPALTPREREVCARAAMGISVEGCALDLGIAASSVLTYRKRAYQRLGISSAYELARLVLR
ncbi:helix-turn-helix transcriptional regulator [Sphingobium lignivorans]|uniref:DNA-binding CsgD family transcriptional regulator n=1 Tax=Sphingobium lignivorans TaxID=2735886 RepID=A0ABR6NEI2_9SPHN|nr:helix-turn-helix transcriptional regulator [Sphingobium lignivorans]MBB5985476.1 DNA-binding CsgD family transcriptional regulator [Sphingobium lignivorans]